MRKTIVRTIVATTINSVNVTFEKGAPVMKNNEPLSVNGTIDEEKALKVVRKTYGENAQVISIDSVNDVYEISVDDFMKYAKKVDAPTPETAEVAPTE